MAAPQTFYTLSRSPNAWRVAIYVHEKGLKPDVKQVDFAAGEHKSADYLAINPRGQVPTWKDGDTVIVESIAIMMYLEAKHGADKPLIPTKPEDLATFYTRLFQYPAKMDPTAIGFKVFRAKMTKEQLKPQIADLLKEHQKWDEALQGREYLANTFSIADITLIPIVTTNVMLLGLGLAQFPNLEAWYKRMWARPSVKETCPYEKAFAGQTFERVLEGETA